MDSFFLEILKRAKSEQIQFNICLLARKLIKKFSIDEYSTEKASMVVFASLALGSLVPENDFWSQYAGEIDIAVKMFFDKKELRDKSASDPEFWSSKLNEYYGLAYEVRVYEFVAETILKPRKSPNFISFLGYGECDIGTLLSVQGFGEQEMFRKNYMKFMFSQQVSNGDKFCILMTQRPKNVVSLFDKIVKELKRISPENQNRKQKIVFQILYSCCVLESKRLMHNDMHANNVLVQTLPSPVTITYGLPDGAGGIKYYSIDTIDIVYIFDWDMAYCPALGNNIKITNEGLCDAFSICNNFMRSFDLYTVACTLYWEGFESLRRSSKAIKEREAKQFEIDNTRVQKLEGTLGDFSYGYKIKNKILYKSLCKEAIKEDKPYFFATRQQLEEILVPEDFAKLGTVKAIRIRSIYPDSNYAYLRIGYQCRLTFVDDNLLSPYQMIQTNFGHFVVSEKEEFKNTAYVCDNQQLVLDNDEFRKVLRTEQQSVWDFEEKLSEIQDSIRNEWTKIPTSENISISYRGTEEELDESADAETRRRRTEQLPAYEGGGGGAGHDDISSRSERRKINEEE